MTITDCQNERLSAGPTNNVLITLTQNNLYTLIERGAEAEAREAVEQVWESASRHTVVPSFDIALKQMIDAQKVADPNLPRGAIVQSLARELGRQINLENNGEVKLGFVQWCVKSLCSLTSFTHVERGIAGDKVVWFGDGRRRV